MSFSYRNIAEIINMVFNNMFLASNICPPWHNRAVFYTMLPSHKHVIKCYKREGRQIYNICMWTGSNDSLDLYLAK